MVVVWLNSANFSAWWQLDPQPTNHGKKSTKSSSLSIQQRQVKIKINAGFVALKDLRKVAKDLGELTDDNTLQEMIERADFDQDGVVSEQEFYNLLTKKAYWNDWFASSLFYFLIFWI